MPTYEYACTSCHNEWEVEQSIKDNALKECPKCHEQTARRQISRGAGFILKGSGWYADLYSSSSNKPSGGGDKGASDKGGGDKGGGDKGSGDKGGGDKGGGDKGGSSSSDGDKGGSGGTTPPAPSGGSGPVAPT